MTRQVILELGAEAGTLTLFAGKSDSGQWKFWTETDESAIHDLRDEEDRRGLGSLVSTSKSVSSLPEALELFDKYQWFRLIPLEIDPE